MELVVYLLQRLSGFLYAAVGSLLGLAFVIPSALNTWRALSARVSGAFGNTSPYSGLDPWTTAKPIDQLSQAAVWFRWPAASEWLLAVQTWFADPEHVPVITSIAGLGVFTGMGAFLAIRDTRGVGPWEAMTVTILSLAALAQVGVGVWPLMLGAVAGLTVLGGIGSVLGRESARWDQTPRFEWAGALVVAFIGTLFLAPVIAVSRAHGA